MVDLEQSLSPSVLCGNATIDLFAISRKELKRARPILKVLATVGYWENPLCFGDKRSVHVSVTSPCKLELFSIYLHLSRVA